MLIISQDRGRFVNLDVIAAMSILSPRVEGYGKWRMVAFTSEDGEDYIVLGDFLEEHNAVFAMYDIVLAYSDKCAAKRVLLDKEAKIFSEMSYGKEGFWPDGFSPLDDFEDEMLTGETYSRVSEINEKWREENDEENVVVIIDESKKKGENA